MKKCSKCGVEAPEEYIDFVEGQELCDDCSMILSMQRTLKKCDPIAVHSALTARRQQGHAGAEGLTPRQKELYDFIGQTEGSTAKQLAEHFGMTQEELDIALTVLRHMELCKGEKREDGVYTVLWEK